LKVPCLADDDLLIFRKSKKRYDKWETGLIEHFDGTSKIFDVFEVSKQQCKVVLAVSFYDFDELNSIQAVPGTVMSFLLQNHLMRKWSSTMDAWLTEKNKYRPVWIP